MFKIVLVVLIAGLSDYATVDVLKRTSQYKQNPSQVVMPDDTYRVFDHPTEKAIMTTTSLAVAFGSGVATGATLGLVPVVAPEQRHEAAARKFLDDTGRENCTITSGYLLAQPQYEFTYECPGSTS